MKQKTYIVEKTVVRELPEMERPSVRFLEDNPLFNLHVRKILAAYNEILSRQPTITRGDNGFWKEGQIVPASELDLVKQRLDSWDSDSSERSWKDCGEETYRLSGTMSRRLVAIPKQKEGGEGRDNGTLYTYYQVDLSNSPLDWDGTICESLDEVRDLLEFLDVHLDDPDNSEFKVSISGIPLTPKAYRDWKKNNDSTKNQNHE